MTSLTVSYVLLVVSLTLTKMTVRESPIWYFPSATRCIGNVCGQVQRPSRSRTWKPATIRTSFSWFRRK